MDSNSSAVLIGAGAVGLPLAAALAEAGCKVTVCGGRVPIDEITITKGDGTRSYPVAHAKTPEEAPQARYVILAVKAYQTKEVAPWLRACGHNGVSVLVAQNGVEHEERVAPYIGEAHAIPSVLFFNNDRTAPGKVIVRRGDDGYIVLPDTHSSRSIADKLSAGGLNVSLAADFRTAAWSKLLTNITANPLTALTGRRPEVIREPEVALIARKLMMEALAVARADGVALTEDHVEQAMGWLNNVPVGSTTSMREDRIAGRPLEHDALTGAVLRVAKRHRIGVPINQMIFALLSAVQPKEAL